MILALASQGWAQEPETRADELRRQREEKAKQLEPPEPSAAERGLLRLENGRLFERLLNPAEGLYPKIGNITRRQRLRRRARLPATAPLRRARRLSARSPPSPDAVLDGRGAPADAAAGRRDGGRGRATASAPISRTSPSSASGRTRAATTRSIYALGNTAFGGRRDGLAEPWLSLGGATDYLTPGRQRHRRRGCRSTACSRSPTRPASTRSRDFIRYEATADVNYREPRGNPRRGGRTRSRFQQFDDRDERPLLVPARRDRPAAVRPAAARPPRAGAARARVDVGRRTRRQRALLSAADARRAGRSARLPPVPLPRRATAAAAGGVPLGDLHRRGRRDLLRRRQGGAAASRISTSTTSSPTTASASGSARSNGVFLRVEGAFGSSGGKHFVLRFGHVF